MEELDLGTLLDTLKEFERGERVILGHFGTVQTLLSLIFGGPVAVKLIDQGHDNGVIVRRAQLAAGREVLCVAVSRISTLHNRAEIIDDIGEGELGLGQIIARHKLSTSRSLVDLGRDQKSFWRTYDINGPDLEIQISETFPRAPFESIGWLRPVDQGKGVCGIKG